jgi:hypothetical protein
VNSIFALRALAEESSLQPRENRRYGAARKAAVEAICSDPSRANEQGADEPAVRGSREKSSQFKPRLNPTAGTGHSRQLSPDRAQHRKADIP